MTKKLLCLLFHAAGFCSLVLFVAPFAAHAQVTDTTDVISVDSLLSVQEDSLNLFSFDEAYLNGLSYRMVGPHRGGRVTAVAGDGGAVPTLYFGGTGGGVWRSRNNGTSYENVSDGYFEVGSIGALAVSPADSNIVFAGTGSVSIRSNVSTGRGVYRSLDQGDSWDFLGLPETGQIGNIALHPTRTEIAYVAALGHPFGPNPDRGVYRTVDGGESWEHILFLSDSTGAISLAINPDNPDEIYAGMWRGERKPWTIISGNEEGGVYKTTDGGETWVKLKNGLPEGIVGKMDIVIAPSNSQRVFVLIEAADKQGGLYRSDDGGTSFKRVNERNDLLYRPFYYTYITADPHDPNSIYVSNEGFFHSADGGVTFRRIRTPHGDHHALWINPDQKNFLFQGNDGGATVSLDGGASWTSILNQPTAELYHVVVDNQVPYYLYGEQQDNTTIRVPSLPPQASGPLDARQHWLAVAGCETGPIAVHPDHPEIIYGGCKGRFSRLNLMTGQEQQYWVYPHFNYGHAARDMPYRFQRTSPIELSPHNPTVIYHASQYVHRTTNEGRNWEVISPDLTANEPDKQGYSGEPITRDITGEEIYSAIYQLRESPVAEGVLWAGANDGPVHISKDGGANWVDVTPPVLPGGRVQTIEPSPHDSAKAYIAIYRYMLDDWTPYIYKTTDFGQTWDLLTTGKNGIPANEPTRVIREDPDRPGLLYAGTEFGMYLSFDEGMHWIPFQGNLPATPITDIKVHQKDLAISTMGRSFWILDDVSPLHHIDPETPDQQLTLFPPRAHYRLRWSPGEKNFDGSNPEYPKQGAPIYYSIPQNFEGELFLDILDRNRDPIITLSSTSSALPPAPPEPGMRGQAIQPLVGERLKTAPGLHKVYWDLHYPPPGWDLEFSDQRPAGYINKGPLAVPGKYFVRMRTDRDTLTTEPLDVLIDPRTTYDDISEADMEAQFLFLQRLDSQLDTLYHTLAAIDTLTAALERPMQDTTLAPSLSDQARDVHAALSEIEEQLIQQGEGKIGAQLQPRMMRQFTYLRGMLTFADQPPGEDAYLRLTDLERLLREAITSFKNIEEVVIEALNDDLLDAGERPVTMPKN